MLSSLSTRQFVILSGLISILAFYFGARFYSLILLNLAWYIACDFEHVAAIIRTLPRDVRAVSLFAQLQIELVKMKRKELTVPQLFEQTAKKYSQKLALVSVEDETNRYTFQEADAMSNQIANYFLEKGFRKGDCVALFMVNSPEYLIIWIGLAKIGVVTALINFNQKQKTLGHSMQIAKAKAAIYGAELHEVWKNTLESGFVEGNIPQYIVNTNLKQVLQPFGGAKDLLETVKDSSRLSPNLYHQMSHRDPLIYIYTSGTTGLPKAAVLTNARFYMMARGVFLFFGLKSSDRIYLAMPMYHSAGGILGAGNCLISGCSLAVRSKFSASRFWDECIKFECTVSQYIGEICRYLLTQPYKESETKHTIRTMIGNGLRAGIWMDFKNRFQIPYIAEFYGSTEGNAVSLNFMSHPGACGFMSVIRSLKLLYPAYLIKVDPLTGEPIRNENGLCVSCEPGEHGEMVAKIVKGDPVKDFVGYVSETATKKKLIRNVVTQGDLGFASGDILYMDQDGYLFFKDRTGDTFRWKGENVSTTEVEGVVQEAAGLVDACVYGVSVPDTEGAAGMAAIAGEVCDLNDLFVRLKEKLPNYSIPVFLRFCRNVDLTGTFKLNKVRLRSEGFDPSAVSGEPLFYLNAKGGRYEPLTAQVYADIQSGVMKF